MSDPKKQSFSTEDEARNANTLLDQEGNLLRDHEEPIEIEEEEDEDDDPFRMWIAILIAIVTLVGAWMGWRTAEVSGVAGDADAGGIGAVINAELTLTLNSLSLYKHYRAFTEYARYQSTAELLEQESASTEANSPPARKSNADDLAAVQLPFFQSRYLTRDGAYNSRRELGEAWAQTEQTMDLDPDPYFEESDLYTIKTINLIGLFVVLSLSLLFYTLAEGLHRERTFWRYTMAALGTLTLIFSVWGTLLVSG